MKRRPWLLMLLLLLSPLLQAAFITDNIRVGFYKEPDTKTRPIKVLLSGEEITELEQRGAFVKVRLTDGSTGWIGRQYVSNDEPAVRSLVESRKEVARLSVELDQTRQELLSVQQEIATTDGDTRLKDALAAANRKIAELEARAKKPAPKPGSCEQQLDEIEAKELQCQVRLAKFDKENKDSVVAENEKLRELMQQATNLLAMPANGELPVMIPASVLTANTRIITQKVMPPAAPAAAAPVSAAPAQAQAKPDAGQAMPEEGLPVWVYLLMVLTLITGIIGGFALFDYRSRYRYSIRL
jgi:hypothetical protein